MPKRKHDFEYISRKIRKLERKINRARRRRDNSQSSHTTSSSDTPQGEVLDDMMEEACPPEVNTNTSPHNPSSETTAVVDILEEEVITLDTEVLEILGDDPSANTEYGAELHKEVASRLEHIAICGLSKELRKELQQKYILPVNAIRLGAPLLNSEIKAALPEILVNRDKAIEAKQKLLSSAISCLGATITKLLESKEKNTELLSKIMDASRILCDVQHSDSITRRKFSCSSLKKEIKDQVQNTKIDKYLFGEALAETLKAAKVVSKSGAEIKTFNSNTAKTKPKPNPFQPKNWKTPPARRPPAPPGRQENREPAYRPNQPYKHSKPSSHPSKQHRRC